MQPSSRAPSRASALALAALACALACEPGATPALEQRMDARTLVAQLRAGLHASAEAEKRAVMSDTEEAAAEAAAAAERQARAVSENTAVLAGHLAALAYEPEAELLRTFEARFAESQRLDAELLALARANSNERAWRLALGEGREAADDLATQLGAAVRAAPRQRAARAEAAAAAVLLAVREIQVLEAPHIREPEDAAMTALEARIAQAAKRARRSLAQLAEAGGAPSRPALDAASASLDAFLGLHAEVLRLSRENTDVRSLALSLGEKRRLTAACDDALSALQDALAQRGARATR